MKNLRRAAFLALCLFPMLCVPLLALPVQIQDPATQKYISASVPLNASSQGRATYEATTGLFTPAATPTDVVSIIGSSTKTVRILRISLTSTQTTAGINNWFLIKRSTASSGGSPASATLVPADSADSAATASVVQYTANPTPGTAIGTIKVTQVLSPAATSTTPDEYVIYDESLSGKPQYLRGVAQSLNLNFAGAAVPAGLSMAVNVRFTEE